MTDTDSLLQFPADYSIKVMGRRGGALREIIAAIIEKHVGPGDAPSIRERESRAGNFVALTVTLRASSRAQLDAIYRELSQSDQVLMSL
jgi:uncharacterized protein